MNRPRSAAGRRRLLAAAALAALLPLTACSGSDAEGGPSGSSGGPIRSVADITLPMDHYRGTWEDAVVVETAFEELVAECMADRGFPGYPVTDFSSYAQRPLHGNIFGVVSVEEAARDGFTPAWIEAMSDTGTQLSERFAGWGGDDVMRALTGRSPGEPGVDVESLTEEQREAGIGVLVPPGGCQEEAHRALFELGGVDPMRRGWVSDQSDVAILEAYEDASLEPQRQAWRECMRAAGHDYETREDAAADERWLSDEEGARRAAVASATCTQESGLIDAWVALAAELQRERIEADPERFQASRDAGVAILEAIRERGMGNVGGRDGGPPPG